MNARSISALVWCFFAFSGLGWAETLASVDAKARLINVDTGTGLKAYRLKDPLEVRVNGVISRLEELQPGMQVTLGLTGGQEVVSIVAVSARPVAGTSASINATRHIDIRLKMDGKDLLMVRGGKMWIEHKEWTKPKDITLNGRRWKPVWTGDKSDEFIDFVPPLGAFDGAPIEVKKVKGRGSISMKQSPTVENGQTLIVEFNDATESGAAEYEARITW